ncbi:MAG: LemA protein, partial [Actinomycetota bacterium]|nr:LemA protein [Actinomycetota bacterium]
SWSNIDTELRRRYDLIPNLVSAVKGYAAHESALFAEVTAARRMAVDETGPPELQEVAERPLVASLQRLMAVAEAYPELQASEHFGDLERQLALTEDRIQAARRFYNANVRDYNRRVQSFPSGVVAWALRFEDAPYFTIDPAVRSKVAAAPDVTLGGASS